MWNFKWSIADMDKITRMAHDRMPLRTIALKFGVTNREMEELMVRNGIFIRGDRQW